MAIYGFRNTSSLLIDYHFDVEDSSSLELLPGYEMVSGSFELTSSDNKSAYDLQPQYSGFFSGSSFTGSLTGSFNDYSGSLGWVYDFPTGSWRTGSFTGSFTGSLLGTSSYSQTSSFVQNIKSGVISTGEWVLDMSFNYTASVAFSSSYMNTNYSLALTPATDVRSFTVTNKRTNGFNVNSNSGTPMTDDVYWVVVPYNNS